MTKLEKHKHGCALCGKIVLEVLRTSEGWNVKRDFVTTCSDCWQKQRFQQMCNKIIKKRRTNKEENKIPEPFDKELCKHMKAVDGCMGCEKKLEQFQSWLEKECGCLLDRQSVIAVGRTIEYLIQKHEAEKKAIFEEIEKLEIIKSQGWHGSWNDWQALKKKWCKE